MKPYPENQVMLLLFKSSFVSPLLALEKVDTDDLGSCDTCKYKEFGVLHNLQASLTPVMFSSISCSTLFRNTQSQQSCHTGCGDHNAGGGL